MRLGGVGGFVGGFLDRLLFGLGRRGANQRQRTWRSGGAEHRWRACDERRKSRQRAQRRAHRATTRALKARCAGSR